MSTKNDIDNGLIHELIRLRTINAKLLAALKEGCQRIGEALADDCIYDPYDSELRDWLLAARAAIAQAEEKQS